MTNYNENCDRRNFSYTISVIVSVDVSRGCDHDLAERRADERKLRYSLAFLNLNPGFSKTLRSRETTERREAEAMKRTKRGLLR